MANEITITAKALIVNGDYRQIFDVPSLRVDQAALGSAGGIIDVGTSEETLVFGDVTVPGYVFFRNVGTVGNIQLGPDATGMVAAFNLEPGDVALGRLDPSSVWIAIATVATQLHMLLLED